MSNFNNIPTGLLVPAQVPLDAKVYKLSQADLANLGPGNNLAYTYFKGMIAYCAQEQTRWEWREPNYPGEIGLILSNFVYPSGLTVFGINYSNKAYNFFQVTESITVNDYSPVNNLTIQGTTVQTWNSQGDMTLTIDNPLPYKAYRAKIVMQAIDWPGYGYLYNWYAVNSVRGLANPGGGTGLTAPNEWRVPSNIDWNTLVTFAGGPSVAGGRLKSTLNSTAYPFYGWLSNGGGTDDYNFGALGGGARFDFGLLVGIGNSGTFWSSTSNSSLEAFAYFTQNTTVVFASAPSTKADGISVRLVREATAGELLLNDGDTSDTSSLDPYTGNDGKTYITVKIGTQIWLAQNLRETKYNDNSDIFNASVLGGDGSNSTWQAKGVAQEGAWTAYRFNGSAVEYDPTTIKAFYNDVLENTLDGGLPIWVTNQDGSGPIYFLSAFNRNWNKTHIKVTPGYDVSDFPTINERSLLIETAPTGNGFIRFRPIKRDNTGTITIEDLNNYNDLLGGGTTSSIYIEILEYSPTPTPPTPYYYYGNNGVGIGISNL